MESKNYKDIRTSYEKSQLTKEDLNPNPIIAFKEWFDVAIESNIAEPNVMTLSTCNKDGKPSSRIVLLKGIQENGLIFYTNYKSKKGLEIEQNPNVSILFFWQELQRQVSIQGVIKKNSSEDSDAYFNSRPIESQLGAMASKQSEILKDREELENKFESIKELVPSRPVNWGGYIVEPTYFEFWQGRANRLHDRISYEKKEDSWITNRLSP